MLNTARQLRRRPLEPAASCPCLAGRRAAYPAASVRGVSGGRFEEVHNLPELVLGLVNARHVVECGAWALSIDVDGCDAAVLHQLRQVVDPNGIARIAD